MNPSYPFLVWIIPLIETPSGEKSILNARISSGLRRAGPDYNTTIMEL
jgi:hypothetical protein